MTTIEKNFCKKLFDFNYEREEDINRISTINMAIKSARKNSGRNLLTGEYCFDELNEEIIINGLYQSQLFTATCMYLIVLDQIGAIFTSSTLKPKPNNDESGIKVALKSFATPRACNDEISAIKALRNALAHNFGLCGSEGQKESKKHYHFSLNYSQELTTLIRIRNEWNGAFNTKSDANETEVGLHALCNLVENIIKNIRNMIDKDLVKLRLEINDIKVKFTIL